MNLKWYFYKYLGSFLILTICAYFTSSYWILFNINSIIGGSLTIIASYVIMVSLALLDWNGRQGDLIFLSLPIITISLLLIILSIIGKFTEPYIALIGSFSVVGCIIMNYWVISSWTDMKSKIIHYFEAEELQGFYDIEEYSSIKFDILNLVFTKYDLTQKKSGAMLIDLTGWSNYTSDHSYKLIYITDCSSFLSDVSGPPSSSTISCKGCGSYSNIGLYKNISGFKILSSNRLDPYHDFICPNCATDLTELLLERELIEEQEVLVQQL